MLNLLAVFSFSLYYYVGTEISELFDIEKSAPINRYAGLNLDEVEGLREIEAEFYSYFNGQLHANRIWTG